MAVAFPTTSLSMLDPGSSSLTESLSTHALQDLESDVAISSDDVVVQIEGRSVSSTQADDASERDLAEVYLSVVWGGGKLGAAYYDADTTEIYVMSDTTETDDFQILRKVLQQIRPTNIVSSSKQDDRFLAMLREAVEVPGGKENFEGREDILHLLPSIDFSPDICKRRILSLELPGIPDHFTDTERTLFLSSLIPMEYIVMVRALGGLLKFLDKKRVGVELEEAQVRVPVIAIRTISLEDLVIVDDNTYNALQIFQRESHPSVYKAGSWSSAKEGLSLFGIMNRCKSQLGSKMLRLWFLRPMKNIVHLNERLDAISFFTNPRNLEVYSSLQGCLRHIKNIPKILVRMKEGQVSPVDWQVLYKTVYNAIYIGDICRGQPKTISIFAKISGGFNADLHIIANLITKIVDFEESTAQGRFVVKPNVDADLDQRKRTFNGLPDFMTKVAKEEMKKLSSHITECNVLYLPQLGYLLAVPFSGDIEQNEYRLPGLTFMFSSNGMAHYKSEKTKELDELLGDTQCEIADQEMSIMLKLQNSILQHFKVLMDVMHYSAELDCLLSLATSAMEIDLVRPKLSSDNIIQVIGNRHPLQEMCCNPFVPNDINSGGEHGKMKVLTGPNASGKSVYLKQVAMLVFMAHIGSFVPAESAVVGMIDRIFTRIKTMESVSVGLSTFMIDLNQVSCATLNATEKSLVILDEFGKGTQANDGMALLCAVLENWLNKNEKCPHTFVSTHFHAIVQKNLLPQSDQLKFMTMDVLKDNEDLVFLYQLKEGSVNCSHAAYIAKLAGIPENIIKRGIEVTDMIRSNHPISRMSSASTEEHDQMCDEICKQFMELNLEDLNAVHQYLEWVLKSTKGKI